MTGTASEVFDYSNKEILCELSNHKSNSIIQLTEWIFGTINTDCILNDITECGCSILLPKILESPTNTFMLLIKSPHNDEKVHSTLNSQTRWQDEDFTQTHKKMGIKFLDVSEDQRREINILERMFRNPDHSLIKCNFLIP